MRQKKQVAERFWNKVLKTQGCWLWQGAANRYGHGVFRGQFGQTTAHRQAWILTHGDPGPAKFICHNCPGGDTPGCVNPAHMFLGTAADNTADMYRKGRQRPPIGVRNRSAKLTPELVREIRLRYAAGGTTMQSLADAYGVSIGTIHPLLRGKTWKEIL